VASRGAEDAGPDVAQSGVGCDGLLVMSVRLSRFLPPSRWTVPMAPANTVVTFVLHPSILPAVDLALVTPECQGGERVLDDRKLAVLRAIVQDYVSTNEPVGSKSLVDRHNLDVSPATIRNDMAVLEEQGFIVQPHTSAGRVPTDKGYRLFVDRLSQSGRFRTPSAGPSRHSWPAPSTSTMS
jgi:hypothetical protein